MSEQDPTTSALVPAPAQEMAVTGETSAAAHAAEAQAIVLALFGMAKRNPRNMGNVRVNLLADCERPRFAEAARYSIPFAGGKPARGFTIRFAEAAVLALGNLSVATPTVFEDEDKRIMSARVIDLENTVLYAKDFVIEKVVERRNPGKRQPLGTRENSYGDTVFLVRATEQELRAKAGSEASKAIRDQVLRILPADIKEECEDRIARVLERDNKENPGEAMRRICDGFMRFGVRPSDLEALLGHKLDGVIPAELHMLRTYYSAIRDGEATWPQIVEAHAGPKEGEDDPHADLRKQAQEQLRKSKSKSKKAAKKKAAKKKEEPPLDEPEDPAGVAPPPAKSAPSLSEEEVAQGWEMTEDGEKIPPMGWGDK